MVRSKTNLASSGGAGNTSADGLREFVSGRSDTVTQAASRNAAQTANAGFAKRYFPGDGLSMVVFPLLGVAGQAQRAATVGDT